jgi:hypothetical protein
VSASNNTRYGDSAAAKSLFAIVYEQPKSKSLNRRVSAFLSNYSYAASQLEQMSDPHTVGTMQKMLMHSSMLRIVENFGDSVLATHMRNVLKIRYRQFERRARERIKEANRQQKIDERSRSSGSTAAKKLEASNAQQVSALIGIAAKYIQTAYIHDFSNEVRAFMDEHHKEYQT